MKKFNLIFKIFSFCVIFIICIVVIEGCNDFLKEEPKSNITTENFFKSDEDAIGSVNGVYNVLRDPNLYRQEFWYYVHIGTDIAMINPGERNDAGQEISRYTINPTTSRIAGIWASYYSGIGKANLTIEKVNDNPLISPELAKRVDGEAKFLRGLFYFHLLRFWGGVPLVTKVFNNPQEIGQFTRAAEEEVYNQIISDLKDAENELPVSYNAEDIGRATRGAASALLGSVFLQKKDWDNAANKLSELIGKYSLSPDYQELFYSRNENGPESIFEVQFLTIPGAGWTDNWQGNIIHTTFGSPEITAGTKGSGWASVLPTQEFYGSYDLTDERRDVTLIDSHIDNDGTITNFVNGPYINKYNDAPDAPYFGVEQTDMNFYVLRYADVLLMLAEALNEKNNGPTPEAYNNINAVRARAGVAPLPIDMTKAEFSEAILQERAWELAFEGHRRFDLVRFGKLVEAVKSTSFSNPDGAANVKPHNQLWPIPQEVIDVSPEITQNPGY